MLLIYTPNSTTRLQYICKFIFEELLKTSYTITIDEFNFKGYDGNKINYSNTFIEHIFQIKPHALITENGILPQQIDCFKIDAFKAFFKTENADYPFDIFAASFYLISRYEEYLPHDKDMYGRYAHENSLAFKEDFLKLPLVNIWLAHFKKQLQKHFPTIIFKPSIFTYLPTYDIDMAWSYKEKGLLRNAGGFLKSPSIGRLTAMLGLSDDPFDSYAFLNDLHKKYHAQPLYFFLMAKENGMYDKNILPTSEAFKQLIKDHAAKYSIGIHPSWKSNDDVAIVKDEKSVLENIANVDVTSSRQHYIKFDLPKTFHNLIEIGITDDYSMGYGSINGFRASVANSFYWYDLAAEKITTLRMHPFCFMDANCYYEQKLSVTASTEELNHYYKSCKEIDGTLITIFHNNILGTDKSFVGWSKLYENFISQVQQ
jgi:hypothetical protein